MRVLGAPIGKAPLHTRSVLEHQEDTVFDPHGSWYEELPGIRERRRDLSPPVVLTDAPAPHVRMHEFLGQAQHKGLKRALQDRDQPFGDYRTTHTENSG
jgi:hypothetical protein